MSDNNSLNTEQPWLVKSDPSMSVEFVKPLGPEQDQVIANINNDRTLASKLPIPTRLPNSKSLEKLYKGALKEMSKLKSSVQPNLTLKRSYSQTTVSPEYRNTAKLANAGWIEPKRFAKNHNIRSSQRPIHTDLTQDSNPQELLKIKSLAYQKIWWEPLRKREIFQCTNCQRLGHSSANCALGYRCVKCKEAHEPGKCSIDKDNSDKSLLYCVNCESSGHPASYRGCPFFKFAKDLKNSAKAQNQKLHNNKINKISNHVNRLANYDLIRVDRKSSLRGGGTAILINSSIKYEKIFFPSSSNNKILEYAIIKIKSDNHNIFLAALYANNDVNKIFTNEINYLFEKLNIHSPNNYFIMAGDLNARHTSWGDIVSKTTGIMLKKWEETTGILYRTQIIPPSTPSFPSANSYLDLCIIDNRLKIKDLVNNKINTTDYNSDHKPLLFTVDLHESISIHDPSLNHRFIFKKTKWKKFSKKISTNYDLEIPENKNLTNDEIIIYIKQIESNILDTIKTVVPKYKPKNNVLNYINKKIKNLHKYKSFLITSINNSFRRGQNSLYNTSYLKYLVNKINVILKGLYQTSYTSYWETQHKLIDHRDPTAFFPLINRFFRLKEPLNIQSITIDQDNTNLLIRSEYNVDNLTKVNNKYTIQTPSDILNTIGSFFETINAPRFINQDTPLKNLVDTKVDTLTRSFINNTENNLTVTSFTDENPSTSPQFGLMQGTVNSPALFNISTHNIPNLFNLNRGNNTHSIAFADDLIILTADENLKIAQNKLEILVNKINNVYAQWNLRINPSKCETIVFHKPLRFLAKTKRNDIKNFNINIKTKNNTNQKIENKKKVKYLGIQLDYLLRLNDHTTNQLQKAKNSFRSNSRIFFNKHLSPKTKIICYLLLIRPLLTYAAPILWNMGASLIEKLRKFERMCIRTALHIFRKDESSHFINSQFIYNKAGIPRIDNFQIGLTRNYFANLPLVQNKYLNSYIELNNSEINSMAQTGYLTPQAFMFFDKRGYIQDDKNVPILYHHSRHQSNKTITFNPSNPTIKYSTTLPEIDGKINHKINKKYWWLVDDGKFHDELRRRRRRINP
ncbi:hypothetical protein TSAR_006387 [Trichomalopsis sarcophagae]|uniref:Reverse transcriptase domain-containing protein n=1 Tax=Trichomalopsis sarcophagae TaxID=543379 RepID=A0A232EFA8_9HYME|nr:hypothetical protein TSAR_006387 [Trichomalopsis sarcophagae]